MINASASLRSDYCLLCVGIAVCLASESLSGFVGIRTLSRFLQSCTQRTDSFTALELFFSLSPKSGLIAISFRHICRSYTLGRSNTTSVDRAYLLGCDRVFLYALSFGC
jgi:hypothetical protein